MEIVVLFWILLGVLCAYIASQKNRNCIGWFVLGLIGGIFAVIAIAAVPSRKKEE